jgi:hypothetical protein
MYEYQKKLWDKIASGGFKPGELVMMHSGRGLGKSVLSTQQAIDRLLKDLMQRPVEELVLGEGRFHGARFYTVEPVGGNWLDMQVWCTSTFGEAAEVWELKSTDEQFMWPEVGRWYANNRKFWFRNEADRTLFVLKWR